MQGLVLAAVLANGPQVDRIDRLASFLCELQPRLRWKRGRPWTPAVCQEAAQAYVNETAKAGIHDLLAVAVSIQESDLVDTTVSKDGHDSGLMGIRWPTAFTRGLKKTDVIKIAVNIRLGVAELAHWRDIPLRTTEVREFIQLDGRRTARAVSRPCDHVRGHAYWLHYNNGSRRSRDTFKARYDRRVLALYLALCNRLGEELRDAPEVPDDAVDVRTQGLVKLITEAPWADPAAPTALADVAR